MCAFVFLTRGRVHEKWGRPPSEGIQTNLSPCGDPDQFWYLPHLARGGGGEDARVQISSNRFLIGLLQRVFNYKKNTCYVVKHCNLLKRTVVSNDPFNHLQTCRLQSLRNL